MPTYVNEGKASDYELRRYNEVAGIINTLLHEGEINTSKAFEGQKKCGSAVSQINRRVEYSSSPLHMLMVTTGQTADPHESGFGHEG